MAMFAVGVGEPVVDARNATGTRPISSVLTSLNLSKNRLDAEAGKALASTVQVNGAAAKWPAAQSTAASRILQSLCVCGR